jgi:hypothetical protein
VSSSQGLDDRFMSKVVWNGDEDECWSWQSTQTNKGYGEFWLDGGNVGAHRVAYELLVGPIAEGFVIDHLCRNRLCVNPAHLEPVTEEENVRRGDFGSAANARKIECIHGHAFDRENTYISAEGYRYCRTCRRDAARRYAQRRRVG